MCVVCVCVSYQVCRQSRHVLARCIESLYRELHFLQFFHHYSTKGALCLWRRAVGWSVYPGASPTRKKTRMDVSSLSPDSSSSQSVLQAVWRFGDKGKAVDHISMRRRHLQSLQKKKKNFTKQPNPKHKQVRQPCMYKREHCSFELRLAFVKDSAGGQSKTFDYELRTRLFTKEAAYRLTAACTYMSQGLGAIRMSPHST